MAALRIENQVLSKVVPIRVNIEDYNNLVATAKRQRTSQTALARLAIRQYLTTPKTSESHAA